LILEDEFFKELKLAKFFNDTMPGLRLNWDGSNIGAIDEHLFDVHKKDDDHILTIWSLNKKGGPKLCQVKILKYKNDVPLIIDECKPLFGIRKIGKHKATLKEHLIILIQYQEDIPIKRYLLEMGLSPEKTGVHFIEEIRKLFVFRWFLCLNNNFENTVEVRTGSGMNYPISCRENTFNYDSCSAATRIPKTVIKTWFNDDEDLVEDYISDFIRDKDISVLRFSIQKIIMRFDKQLISWNNAIFEKMLSAKKESV